MVGGTPPRGKNSLRQWAVRNEPCGCLMSKPGFPSWKRSRSTDLPFLCILLQQGREKKKKAATLGSAWRGGVLNITVRRAERRTAGALGTPWEKGFPGVGLHFESPHHKMIKHKGKKKSTACLMNHCLLQWFCYYFIICHLRTILKGKEPRLKAPWSPSQGSTGSWARGCFWNTDGSTALRAFAHLLAPQPDVICQESFWYRLLVMKTVHAVLLNPFSDKWPCILVVYLYVSDLR